MLVRLGTLAAAAILATACRHPDSAALGGKATSGADEGSAEPMSHHDVPASDPSRATPPLAPGDNVKPAPRAPKGCIDDVTLGHHVYTCHDLAMDVEIPARCNEPGSCGLVVDAHGLTMNAEMEDANTNLRALGAKFGYIVLQPNAKDAPSILSWDGERDDPILHDVIVDAIKALAVDPKRVHFTGFSDGGEASFRFLCKHAELFASVAPAAGGGCAFEDGDTPSREIPVLYMHGTNDRLVSFEREAVAQRDALVAAWNMGEGELVEQGDGFTRTGWTNAKGTVFELLQHDYSADAFFLGGHCFPGSSDPGSADGQHFSLACLPPTGFSWGEEVMKFFVAHH
jgi:dienelactone hydrolase